MALYVIYRFKEIGRRADGIHAVLKNSPSAEAALAGLDDAHGWRAHLLTTEEADISEPVKFQGDPVSGLPQHPFPRGH